MIQLQALGAIYSTETQTFWIQALDHTKNKNKQAIKRAQNTH